MASTVSHVGSVISGATGKGTPTHTTTSSFVQAREAKEQAAQQQVGGYFYNPKTGLSVSSMKDLTKEGWVKLGTPTAEGKPLSYTELQRRESEVKAQISSQQQKQEYGIPVSQKTSLGMSVVPNTQEQFLKQQRDFFMPSISAKEEENTYQGLLTSEYEKLQTKAAKEYETKGKLDEYASLFGAYHGKYTSVNKEQFLSATSDIQRKAERDVNRLAYGRIFQNELSEETTKYYDITKTDKGYLMTPKQDAFNQVAQDVGYKETAPVYLIPNQKEISEKLALTVPISTQVAEDKSLWELIPGVTKANEFVVSKGSYPIMDWLISKGVTKERVGKVGEFLEPTLTWRATEPIAKKISDITGLKTYKVGKIGKAFAEKEYEDIFFHPVTTGMTLGAFAVLAPTLKVLGASSEALGVTKVAKKIITKIPAPAAIKNIANIPKAMGWLYSASVGARVATSKTPEETLGKILASEVTPMVVGLKTGEMILGSKAFAPKLVIKDIKAFSTVDTIYKGIPEAGIPREVKGTVYAKGKGYVSEVFGIKRTPVEIDIETPYTQLGKTDLTLKPISSLFIGGKESRIGEGITKISLEPKKAYVKIKGISKEGYTFPDAKVSLPPETMMPREAISGEIFFKQKPLVTTLRTKPITAKTKLTSDLFMKTPADKTLYFESYKVGKTTVPEIEQKAIFDIDQILYHGTTEKSAEKILKGGLKPAAETGISRSPKGISAGKKEVLPISDFESVYLTPDFGAARGFAGRAVMVEGGKPAVLEIHIPKGSIMETDNLGKFLFKEVKLPSVKPEQIKGIVSEPSPIKEIISGKPKVGLGKITLKEIPIYETRLKKVPSFLDQFKQKIVDISMDIVKPYRKIKVTKEMEDFGWMKPFKPTTPAKDFINPKVGQPSTILKQPKTILEKTDKSLLIGQEVGKAVSENILDIQIKRMAKVLPYEPQFYQRTPTAAELIFLGLPKVGVMPRANEIIPGGINLYLKNLEGSTTPTKELETEYKFISTEKGKEIFKGITRIQKPESVQKQFQIPFQTSIVTPIQDLTFEQGQTQITKQFQLQAPEISLKYKQRPNIFEDTFIETPPPIIIPPLLPWLPHGRLFERGKKGKPVEVTPKYKPSLMALELGIKGKATKKTLEKKELTGLQIRKLPKGFKFLELPSLSKEFPTRKMFGSNIKTLKPITKLNIPKLFAGTKPTKKDLKKLKKQGYY